MADKFKVLVVDDEPDKRQLLSFALEMEGYKVYTAEDGIAGFAAVEKHQPDLIITDIPMPRMDGYEMVRRLRADPRTRYIPVIMQSAARVTGEDVRLGSEVGALGYITDPTDLDLLRARARTLLDFKSYLDTMHEAFHEKERATQAHKREVNRKRATGDFDVFLCHNNKDKELVREIALELENRGVLGWLDEWELRPGLPWQEALQQQIGKIKSAAVFVGENGIGPWQREELNAFLREFVGRCCPVIPVLLPTAPEKPELPGFLQGMTWVDFRKRSPEPMEQLCWGITGSRYATANATEGIPLGPGLPPTTRIIGGHIRYESNSWNRHDLKMIVPVADGSIERNKAGRLQAFVRVLHPNLSAQEMLERLGLDSFSLRSEDTVGSTDPSRPTVFTARRRMSVPASEKMKDFATGREVVLAQDLIIDTETSVAGALDGPRFVGSFSVKAKYNSMPSPLEMRGSFEIHLS